MDTKMALPIHNEKLPFVEPPLSDRAAHLSPRHPLKVFLSGILVAFVISYGVLNHYGLSMNDVFLPNLSNYPQTLAHRPCPHHITITAPGKVALEAHIMSKCPDARDCLRDLVVPTMAKISDKIDFKLSYIGEVNYREPDHPVMCKHGQTECLGNILELCAAYLYPDPKIYLGFAMCMTGNYSHIPERDFVEECALEHGVDSKKLNECATRDDGDFGMGLLRQSVVRSKAVGVVYSCTIRLNGQQRCIRDGGEWKNCPGGHEVENLVDEIKTLAG